MSRKNNVTRGTGLLEGFLSEQRAKLANKKIPSELRSGKILDIGCGSYPNFLISTNFNIKYGLDPSVNIKDSPERIDCTGVFRNVIEHMDLCKKIKNY